MTLRFATAEQRLNSAVRKHLCNAMAAIAGGTPVPVIFDNGYTLGAVGLSGMAGTQPSIELPTAELPVDPQDTTVVVGSANYRISAHMPDGTGWSRAELVQA